VTDPILERKNKCKKGQYGVSNLLLAQYSARPEIVPDTFPPRGKVFDLTLPLDQVAEGYCAMDERRAIKALLRP